MKFWINIIRFTICSFKFKYRINSLNNYYDTDKNKIHCILQDNTTELTQLNYDLQAYFLKTNGNYSRTNSFNKKVISRRGEQNSDDRKHMLQNQLQKATNINPRRILRETPYNDPSSMEDTVSFIDDGNLYT